VSDLPPRASRRPGAAAQKPVPVLVAALATAVWAAVVSSAPVVAIALVAWIAETRSGAPAYDAVRIGFSGWLLAHGVRLETEAGPVGLAPLALTILAFRQLTRAGGNSARATGAASIGAGVRVVAAVTVVYCAICVAAAFLAGTPQVHADLVAAGATTAAVAVVAATAGVVRVNGIGDAVLSRLPVPVSRALPVGAVAAGVVLGAGALLAGASLALAADDAVTLFGAFSPDVFGVAALFGLAVVYAPTAAVWGAAYVVGPGFAIGSGTSVSAFDVSLGPVPAFPLLAAVPAGKASTAASLLLGIPLVAGLVAGIAAARRRGIGERWAATLFGAALAGPVAGALVGLAALAAGGPLGAGRLASVGPSAWRVALVCAVEVTLFAVVGAALVRILLPLTGRAPAPAGGGPGPGPRPAADGDPDPDEDPDPDGARPVPEARAAARDEPGVRLELSPRGRATRRHE
jgi:hypothetical protein